MSDHRERLIETIQTSIIGADQVLEGPYGPRRVTYADYTASGRCLSFIEAFMHREVMPFYANTHTESSGTGMQTTGFREEARRIVSDAVGGDDGDVVIFAGSGATGAINKLVDVLNIRIPAELDRAYGLSKQIPPEVRPVVFIGPYEHHSNELPWRESIADVVMIHEDADGRVDLARLEAALETYADRPLKIGSFSAASNVTGIGARVLEICVLLHRHGALAFWDYAAAAPYVQIEMHPTGIEDAALAYKDAVFLSPHKFIGGPGCPGVLVARRSLFKNSVPSQPGGGTVAYVNAVEHRYLDDPVLREEGGTPNILGAIKTGLVFQLKEAVGAALIRDREHSFTRRAIGAWATHPNIRVLGNHETSRLSIVSFMVKHGDGHLHHNYVVALLNDLFGIQSRGGCSCAGPYGHRLLGIDLTRSKRFEAEVLRGSEGIKPGWARVNFNYFISEEVFDFIIAAVKMVAEEGWKLLPDYEFSPESGRWRHRQGQREPPMQLKALTYKQGRLSYKAKHVTAPEWALGSYLDEARKILDGAVARYADVTLEATALPPDFGELRWFPLPTEVLSELQGCASHAIGDKHI